ncbi:PIR Superfamily Protein [Plasmodium ovale curtisi]|uniref:PIR Superfamily Protein n=1 Tax=Plasmodium ovale curtisi TaxID=864141 RepID=A0A1A8VNP1_PLAOA|nr:PIR Superfamily Protein [Plasmodium ovale curtisi]
MVKSKESLVNSIIEAYNILSKSVDNCESNGLVQVTPPNDDLKNIGCLLQQNYVNAHEKKGLDSADSEDLDYCDILNTWLNYRKDAYTSNGKSCEKGILWESYIEILWNNLGKDQFRTLKSFFLNRINNKGIISNISEEESQQSLEHSENFYPSSLRSRVNIIYNTLGNI